MKKIYFLFLLFFSTSSLVAQVGINTTDPKAQLQIKSSNENSPAITDGLLIPKVNNFPASNPTIAQQGMLVYLKNASGSNQPGFYYWDFATLVWKPIAGATASGTLDQAYDSGGAGLGIGRSRSHEAPDSRRRRVIASPPPAAVLLLA